MTNFEYQADARLSSSIMRAKSLDPAANIDVQQAETEESMPATRRTRSGTITSAANKVLAVPSNISSTFRRTRSGTIVSNLNQPENTVLAASPIITSRAPHSRTNTAVPIRGARARGGTIFPAISGGSKTIRKSSPDPCDFLQDASASPDHVSRTGNNALYTTDKKATRSVVKKVMGKAIGKWKARVEVSMQRPHDEITSDDELDTLISSRAVVEKDDIR